MPPSDPWLSRQNAALKLKGHGVTLDVAGARLRLRATMPPRPTDPAGAEPRQHRISTGLTYPDQASEALQLAEHLGNALERHRLGVESFDWAPWMPRGRQRKPAAVSDPSEGMSGQKAIRTTHQWWRKQRLRGPSADDSWKVDYVVPLMPLKEITLLLPEHLVALVEATPMGSRSRRRASQAAATVARALDWSEQLVFQLRELGKGYSAVRSQARRDLPSNEAIERLIDPCQRRGSGLLQLPLLTAAGPTRHSCLPRSCHRVCSVLLMAKLGRVSRWLCRPSGLNAGRCISNACRPSTTTVVIAMWAH